jgi:acyl carrier protein
MIADGPEAPLDPRAIEAACAAVAEVASVPKSVVGLEDTLADDHRLDVWDVFEVIALIEVALRVDLDEDLPDFARTVHDLARAATDRLAEAGK